jgi:hypothetical protein
MKQYAGLGASRKDQGFYHGLYKGNNDHRQSNSNEALHFKGSQSSDHHNMVIDKQRMNCMAEDERAYAIVND